MTSFSIDFPENMIEPKGLHLPKREDVEQAVTLVKIALDFFPDLYVVGDDEEDWEFIVRVSDEILLLDGKLCDCDDLGEGIRFCPSATEWTVTSIFEMILHTLIGPPDKGEAV